MSDKVKKKIAPTLVSEAVVHSNADTNAFAAAAQKKNPLENAADLIAMRYGISGEAPQINEEVFKQNRALGKKVVPLQEYFDHTAKEFAQKEAEKKEETTRKKREYAKLTPCERKMNTLQRNIDGYIKGCDRSFSNDAFIEMMDKARARASAVKGPKAVKEPKAVKATKTNSQTKGGRRRTRRKLRK